jgi:beta-carotene hydroxylase
MSSPSISKPKYSEEEALLAKKGAQALAASGPFDSSGFLLYSLLLGVLFFGNILAFAYTRTHLYLHSMLSFFMSHLMLTIIHEASHRNVKKGPKLKETHLLNEAVGHFFGFLIVCSFPIFRKLHLTHHLHLNHPKKDPDAFFNGSIWKAIARSVVVYPHYLKFYFGRGFHKESPWSVELFGFYLVLTLMSIYGLSQWLGTLEALMIWILPAVLAFSLDAVVLDWFPHHPHTQKSRWSSSYFAPNSWVAYFFLQGQNYHRLHHLFPWVPVNQYKEANQILLDAKIDLTVDFSSTGKSNK